MQWARAHSFTRKKRTIAEWSSTTVTVKSGRERFRSLWIQRINAAARLNGTTYSTLINALSKSGMEFDRKVLADLAVTDASGFSALCQKVATVA